MQRCVVNQIYPNLSLSACLSVPLHGLTSVVAVVLDHSTYWHHASKSPLAIFSLSIPLFFFLCCDLIALLLFFFLLSSLPACVSRHKLNAHSSPVYGLAGGIALLSSLLAFGGECVVDFLMNSSDRCGRSVPGRKTTHAVRAARLRGG